MDPHLAPALAARRCRFGRGDPGSSEEDWGRWDALSGGRSGRGGGRDGGGGGGGGRGGIRLRTLEELVGSQSGGEDDEWHKEPRWKRVPPLEAGGWCCALGLRWHVVGMWRVTGG